MAFCPNLQDTIIKERFQDLVDAIGDDAAHFVYDKNNGNFLDKRRDGEPSQLYERVLNEVDGNVITANRIVSQIFGSNFVSRNSEQEPHISELDPTYSESPQEAIVKLQKSFKNRPRSGVGVRFRGSKELVVKTDNTSQDVYVEDYEKGTVKRHVAGRFFRYINAKGKQSKPIYPFRVNKSWESNKRYIDFVNAHYNKPVVGVTPEKDNPSIIFRPDVETSIYIGTDEEWQSDDMVDLEVDTFESREQTKEERGVTDAMNNQLLNFINRKNLLEKRLYTAKDKSRIRVQIETLNNQIEKLETEINDRENPGILEEIAMQDANYIEANINAIEDNINVKGYETDEQLLEIMEKLVENSYTIKGWSTLHSTIGSHSDPLLQEKLMEVNGRFSTLANRYNELLSEAFVEYAKRNSPKDEFSPDMLKHAVDISAWQANTSDIGTSNNELLQIVGDAIDKAAFLINEEQLKKQNEVSEWAEKLKKEGYSQKQVNELLQQKHKGKWTGNLVGKTKHEYFQIRNKMRENAYNSNYYNDYLKWLNANSQRLSEKELRSLANGKTTKSMFDKGYNQEELDNQIKLLEEYANDQIGYRERLEQQYGEGNPLIEEEYGYWELNNSPFMAFSDEHVSAGVKYLVAEKPSEEWNDSNFDKIKNNETLNEFYEFLRERFNENNKTLGYFNHFDEMYLPEIAETTMSQILKKKGLPGAFQKIRYSVIDALTDEAESENDSKETYVNGRQIRSINVQMMGNKLHPSIKSGDVFRILNEHTDMSLANKYKSQIEPMVNAATDLLEEVKESEQIIKSSGEKLVKNIDGLIIKKEGRLINTKKALEYATNAFLYNHRKKIEGRFAKANVKKIEKGEDGEAKVVTVKKDFTASKLADGLITYTYIKAMSLPNIVTPAVNAFFGTQSLLVYASANQDMTIKNARKALMQMSTVTLASHGGKSNVEMVNKVFGLMQKFEIIGQIHDNAYGKKKTVSQKITIMQEKAEYYNQGSVMLSMLYSTKLKDKNGNEVSIYDAYKYQDGVIVWDVEKMGEREEVPKDRLYSEDRRNIDDFRLKNYLNEVNKTINGDYKTAQRAKETAVGRILMLFKTWLPKAVEHRFGNENPNKNLVDAQGKIGRRTKGRYLSVLNSKGVNQNTLEEVNLVFKDMIKLLLKGLITKKAFKNLSEIDRVNMIRNAKEIRQIAMIYGSIALSALAIKENDDEANYALNLAINTLTKGASDLSFFVSPSSASQILENLVPVANSVKDIQRAVTSILGIVTGDIYYESGPWRGYPKPLVNVGRALPGFSGAIKMVNLSSKVIDYQK